MFVWVNTPDAGWVIHGRARSHHARAVMVAHLLRTKKKGWQTEASGTRPAPCACPPGAPLAKEAMRSPTTWD